MRIHTVKKKSKIYRYLVEYKYKENKKRGKELILMKYPICWLQLISLLLISFSNP